MQQATFLSRSFNKGSRAGLRILKTKNMNPTDPDPVFPPYSRNGFSSQSGSGGAATWKGLSQAPRRDVARLACKVPTRGQAVRVVLTSRGFQAIALYRPPQQGALAEGHPPYSR